MELIFTNKKELENALHNEEKNNVLKAKFAKKPSL